MANFVHLFACLSLVRSITAPLKLFLISPMLEAHSHVSEVAVVVSDSGLREGLASVAVARPAHVSRRKLPLSRQGALRIRSPAAGLVGACHHRLVGQVVLSLHGHLQRGHLTLLTWIAVPRRILFELGPGPALFRLPVVPLQHHRRLLVLRRHARRLWLAALLEGDGHADGDPVRLLDALKRLLHVCVAAGVRALVDRHLQRVAIKHARRLHGRRARGDG